VANHPELAGQHRETSERNNQIRKLVVSDSLTADDTAPWTETSTIVRRADAHQAVAECKQQPGKEILPWLRPGPTRHVDVRARSQRMAMLADLVELVIGVDTHKHTHTAAVVIAATGAVVAQATMPATPAGYRQLLQLASQQPGQRVWAIEGTGGSAPA
jgi:hypothetical protein